MAGAIGSASGVDLNTASREELERVGGLGPDRAQRIIQQRPIRSWDGLKKIELKNVAGTTNISLPTQLDQTHQSAKDQLSRLSGSKFDQGYMLLMVQEHTKAVQKFQREAASAHDPTVKAFAKNTVPVLQSHLKEARKIEAELKEK